MIDYLTLLLVNMTAGFALLAHFIWKGMISPDQRAYIPGFGVAGAVAVVFGTILTVTWPLPGAYNSLFGEMSVLWGAIFLVTAVSLAKNWPLEAVAGYAFFAGLASVVLAAAILNLGMTKVPLLSAAGFGLSGLGGILALPALRRGKENSLVRGLGALAMAGASALWALTAYPAYWGHMTGFAKWVPVLLRK